MMLKEFWAEASLPTTAGQRIQPPDKHYVKINVDAAFCSTTKVVSLGVVARNYETVVSICSNQNRRC